MRLYTFPISHFSEKARWACDYHGVDYELVRCVPGPHVATMKRLGVRRSSVPVLAPGRGGGAPIQGSDRIIAHLDAQHPATPLTPQDASWRELEKRADRDFGEALRRIFYAEMMTPNAVVPLWSQDGPWWASGVLRAMFPVLKANVTKGYRLYPDDVAEAKLAFDALFDDVEARVERDGYLFEDRLTRVDISVAALISPLVMPEGHPFPWRKHALPASLDSFVQRYQGRPLARWVERLYHDERHLA